MLSLIVLICAIVLLALILFNVPVSQKIINIITLVLLILFLLGNGAASALNLN